MATIEITGGPDTIELWNAVADLADALADDERWCLVGGLMTALFAMQDKQTARPTSDIDLLADARSRPSATEWLTERLTSLGAKLLPPSGLDKERGFRMELGDQVVDILAPDGFKADRPPLTRPPLQALQIPGGTQALNRMEEVEIKIGDRTATLRRPTRLAAILLKARALPVHSDPDAQREDLITLLAGLPDARVAREELAKAERRWLRSIEAKLHLDDPDLGALTDPVQLRAAKATYELLTS